MSNNEPHNYLIAYDITEARRLQKIHRYLSSEGMPVQYSVFTARFTPKHLKSVIDELNAIIDSREDDVRVYPLPRNPECVTIGRHLLPDGIAVLGEGQVSYLQSPNEMN